MPRPRLLTDDDVLDRAIPVFRQNGYAGTSLRDLTEATGLSAAALYHRYGDKDGLFRAALERYADDGLTPVLEQLAERTDPIASIADFLGLIRDHSRDDPLHLGCLLVNTAMDGGPLSPEARTIVGTRLAGVQQFFHERLEHANSAGLLPAGMNTATQTELLLGTFVALRTFARLDPDPGRLDRLVEDAVSRLRRPAPAAA
jgi:TetR/AcrR family transcriptional repressor of nem operon